MESLTPANGLRLPSLVESPITRRRALKLAGWGCAGWLTGVAELLAREGAQAGGNDSRPAKSLIVLWMAGGPSQLETFDPHPGKKISGGTRAIETAVRGIRLSEGLERVAEEMRSIALVRSLVSKEGDHERGTYLVKTGYRPEPTAVHPSIGAICCHELPVGDADIPRHVSILPDQWPARGGYLGDEYDAFKVLDPARKVADVAARVSDPRMRQRWADLDFLESRFSVGRSHGVRTTGHEHTVREARRMMSSDQLKAFDVSLETEAVRASYGDTPFGRGCLAARRLVEVGVRAVEVTLGGWDSHANNHEIHGGLKAVLDPALAALIADLKRRDLWSDTVLLCAGEFGRTPTINRLEGRDHWTHGFSWALAGGRIRGGQVFGATDPEGGRQIDSPRQISDVHATLMAALGIDPHKEIVSPAGRPIKLAEGQPILELLS
jgi:hypothetical protein